MVADGQLAGMIVRCPVCQCEIVHDGVTKSHATYAECLDALVTDLFVIVKRMVAVLRLTIKRNEELHEQLNKAYELKE